MGRALGKILTASAATSTGIGRGSSAHFVTCNVTDLRFCHFISDARSLVSQWEQNSLAAAPRASELSPGPQLEVRKGSTEGET